MPAVPEFTSRRWPRLNENAWMVTTQADPLAQTTTSPSSSCVGQARDEDVRIHGTADRLRGRDTTG